MLYSALCFFHSTIFLRFIYFGMCSYNLCFQMYSTPPPSYSTLYLSILLLVDIHPGFVLLKIILCISTFSCMYIWYSSREFLGHRTWVSLAFLGKGKLFLRYKPSQWCVSVLVGLYYCILYIHHFFGVNMEYFC